MAIQVGRERRSAGQGAGVYGALIRRDGWGLAGGYARKVLSVAPANLYAYWPMTDAPDGASPVDLGPNALTTACLAGTVTLGAPGMDGLTSFYFAAAANSRMSFVGGAFNTAANGSEGTIAAWAKVSDSSVWTDGALRQVLHMQSGVPNELALSKGPANNTLRFNYTTGSNVNVVSPAFGPTNEWFHIALTYSSSGSSAITYGNGASLNNIAVAAPWSGAPNATQSFIGDKNNAGGNPWKGWIAHVAFWNTPLSSDAILWLADRD